MSSLWHRIGADPGLIEPLRAAVDGREDALDLLWWAEHPGEPTPAGAPDPAVALERARRSLYRADAVAGDPRAVAAAAEDRAALLARVTEAARVLLEERDARAAQPAPGRAPGSDPSNDAPVGSPSPSRSRRPLLIAVLAAGAALVVGMTIGALAFGSADRGAATRAAVPAFQVFDRAQRPATDVPFERDAIPSFLDAATVRRLRVYSSVGTTLYAARALDGRVCVLVIVLAAPSPPACTSAQAFALGGLTLIVRATADPVDDSGRRPVDELDITWNPDDTVSITPFGVGSASAQPTGA